MKKIMVFLFLAILVFACGEPNEEASTQNATQEAPKEIKTDNTVQSAEYSSLFTDFTCNMTAAEVAKAINVPESDISMPANKRSQGCSFIINGYGKNGLGDETTIEWFLEKASKAQVKKEIQTYQEMQKTNSSLGMGIEKSETGDTYLAKSPLYGRVIVLNENQDNWLLISYSPRRIYKTRSEEQHLALGTKMIDLANYMLKKHKK